MKPAVPFRSVYLLLEPVLSLIFSRMHISLQLVQACTWWAGVKVLLCMFTEARALVQNKSHLEQNFSRSTCVCLYYELWSSTSGVSSANCSPCLR